MTQTDMASGDQETPRFLVPVPNELDEVVARRTRAAVAALNTQQWVAAYRGFYGAYRALLKGQPRDHRFHKGGVLYDMGLARLFQGRHVDAVKYTLWAFLEDSLSRAEETPDVLTELDMPAARNLVFNFDLPAASLRLIGIMLRDFVDHGEHLDKPREFQDPARLAAYTKADQLVPPAPPSRTRKRVVGQFSKPWDRRVFVGGSYQHQIVEIREAADRVRQRDFDAVVEYEFEIPPELIHHHALMLLHDCRWAVFEVTTEAGQLLELERCRDYGIEPLVVFKGLAEHGRVSPMVETLLARAHLEPRKYGSIDELRGHVDDYLARAEADLASET